MNKKVIGGLVALLILAGLAGNHKQPTTQQVNISPASQQVATESTKPAESQAAVSADPVQAVTTPQSPATTQTITTPAPEPEPTSNCNPNYSPCIPDSPTDLDCADIGQRVSVIGTDVYRLDRDHDGVGCDSY